MKFNKIYFLIFLITTLISCSKNSLKDQIVGQWAIKEITYSGKNYKDKMYTNALIFKDNLEIYIPETFHFKKDKNATWKVLENSNSIGIYTSTTVFDDTFDVEFINRTKTDPLGIILKSDKIYIKAYKLLDFQN